MRASSPRLLEETEESCQIAKRRQIAKRHGRALNFATCWALNRAALTLVKARPAGKALVPSLPCRSSEIPAFPAPLARWACASRRWRRRGSPQPADGQRLPRSRPRLFQRLGEHASKTVLIDPTDLPIVFRAFARPANGRGSRSSRRGVPVNATARIAGPLAALIGLVHGAYDGDALFFSRDLVIEGDTELVLALRNAHRQRRDRPRRRGRGAVWSVRRRSSSRPALREGSAVLMAG